MLVDMTHLGDVLDEDNGIPLAELCAARIDGDVSAIGSAYCALDTVIDTQLRLRVALRGAPAGTIVAGQTAAWVYGAQPCLPNRRTLCFAHHETPRIASSRDFLVRDVVITAEEVVLTPAGSITSPLRTASDLVRHNEAEDSPDVIARLVALATTDVESWAAELSARPPFPYQRRIVAAVLAAPLAVADAVDVIDGVDAAHGVQDAVEVARVTHLENKPADRQAVA